MESRGDANQRIARISAHIQPSFNPQANSGDKLKLYSYWRSSCAHRVRIALALKGLEYEYVPVNLLKGEQSDPDFKKINPMGAVPVFVDGDVVISDSFAIIMYLDDKYPEPPLLPRDLHKRAVNYQAMSILLSGIHPHQNLAVVRYMEEKINLEEKATWVNNANTKGFTALEKLLVSCSGKHATGDEIYLADLFLAPQIHIAINKYQYNMEPYPTCKVLRVIQRTACVSKCSPGEAARCSFVHRLIL